MTQFNKLFFSSVDFDIKMAIDDTATGINSISKFLMANRESLKPNDFVKNTGNNVNQRTARINTTTAIAFEMI